MGATTRSTAQLTVGDVIAEVGRRRSFPAGETLFHEGDPSDSVYVCVEGRIRIFVTLPSGQELLLGIKEPGDEFGELSALDGHGRAASASALDASVVAIISGDRFMDIITSTPGLSVAVFQRLSAQLRRANARLAAHNSKSTAVRTGSMLVELSSMMMRHGGRRDRFDVPITQRDLAEWIGATRESTARALARFRRAGLVDTRRGCIAVLDVVGLNEYVMVLARSG